MFEIREAAFEPAEGRRMQGDTNGINDRIVETVLSGSTYERLRLQRTTVFGQPIPRQLAILSFLLASLSAMLPLYLALPETATAVLPNANPNVASPKVLLLGMVGFATVVFAATLLVGAGLFRLRNRPLTESEAAAVLNLEDLAAFLGLVTGGAATAVTVLYVLVAVAGGETITGFVAGTGGVTPFAHSGVDLTVTEFALLALAGSVALLGVRFWLQRRLPAPA
jgi:hypothetical protein